MNSLRRCAYLVTFISLGLAAGNGGNAPATPIDSAVLKTRIFNDDPGSTLITDNSYPASVGFTDTPTGVGFANLHNFHLADGGVEQVFANGGAFSFSTDLTISGAGDSEAGLQLSPWWSPDIDGRLNVRTTDGEIAAFGGRLPFYSFTGDQGLSYTKGETIRVGMDYRPNALSAGDPATITYTLTLGGTGYTSGPLAFDMGNPAEGYGSWGHLDDARVGGYVQVFTGGSGAGNTVSAQWANISFIPEPTSVVLIGLGILGLTQYRRRR